MMRKQMVNVVRFIKCCIYAKTDCSFQDGLGV